MQSIFRKTGIILSWLSCLCLLASCSTLIKHRKESDISLAQKQPPAWVTERAHSKYPHAFYMTGVGHSEKSSNEADDAARVELLKQIEIEIRGEESAVQTESSQSGPQSSPVQSSTYAETKITSRVHLTVPGLRIVERWTDSRHTIYYSLAVLDREEVSGLLYRQILDLQTKIKGLVKAGEEAESMRDYAVAISRYQETINYIESAQNLISPYNVIKGGLEVPTPQGSAGSHDLKYSYGEIDADLKMRIDRLSTKIPKVSEPTTWEEGIRDLILQMVSRLPPEGILTVLVGDFSEGRSGKRVPLSDLIESDIRITMAGVEDIKVLDQGQATPDLLLTGLFRMDGDVLRINATMKDIKTGAIVAASRVLIRAEEIQDKDLLAKNPPPLSPLHPLPQGEGKQQLYPPPSMGGGEGEGAQGEGAQTALSNTVVEQILTAENSTAPFNVKVWTDKNKFRIGEPVTFYLKADRDCYITLLDQGTSGTLRVIFPNPFQRDNFVKAGKTYSIPDPSVGYEIRVNGPPGIERVKAIASLIKSQIPVEISDRFYEVTPEDRIRLRDLTLSVKRLDDQQWTQSSLEIDIRDHEGKDTGHSRKLKPKRPGKPVDIIGTPGAIDRDDPGEIEPKRPEKPVDILEVSGVRPDEKTPSPLK